MKSSIFCLFFCMIHTSVRAVDEPEIDSFIFSRVDSASLSHAIHACFLEQNNFFSSKPLEVTPVLFSSTINNNQKISEYVLCAVRAWPFNDDNTTLPVIKDDIQWLVLLTRTKYESLELWTLCSALEEGQSRYSLAALKATKEGKVEAHDIYKLLNEWGAFGAFGSRDLWKDYTVLSCSLNSYAWKIHVDQIFDLNRLRAK